MPDHGLFSLDGDVAVVIGGGGVLAGAMAEGLAAAGAAVVIAGRTQEHADARSQSIAAKGYRSLGVQCDSTRRADLERLRDAVLEKFGQVDILINAAGINSATPFFDITEEEWQKIIDVDLKGVFLACQVFGKVMVDAGRGGSVINISSVSSGPPLSKVFTYGVAKGGVNQITEFLAREWAPHQVRVNAIIPGFFPAEQNRKVLTPERVASIMGHMPMKRFGEPDELIGAVLYLASRRASSYVTGSYVTVDGGFRAMTI
jgi:NAD(P)-dependent dehydrogenase (short-subunit alcohol dehydrogenase family)